MKKEELKNLFRDENFLKELNRVDSMESLQRFLSKKGIQMDISDISKAVKSEKQSVLTQEELNNISGGVTSKWHKIAWDCFLFSHTDVC